MLDQLHDCLALHLDWLHTRGTRIADHAIRAWHSVHKARSGVPMAVMVADRAQRRRLVRELRVGLRHLQRTLGASFSGDVAIVVQQIIATDHQLAGCYQIGQRPNGAPFALIRLALQVNGQALNIDEILATLAEQCIGIVTQQNGGLSVIIPIELEPMRTIDKPEKPMLQRDPLTSLANGHRSIATQRVA